MAIRQPDLVGGSQEYHHLGHECSYLRPYFESAALYWIFVSGHWESAITGPFSEQHHIIPFDMILVRNSMAAMSQYLSEEWIDQVIELLGISISMKADVLSWLVCRTDECSEHPSTGPKVDARRRDGFTRVRILEAHRARGLRAWEILA